MVTVLEFFPLQRVNAVPNDATAINNRSFSNNALTTCIWLDNTPENQKIGKANVYAIIDLIKSFVKDSDMAVKRSYGNYGTLIVID